MLCYPWIENASHAGADLWIGSVELQLMTSMFLILIYSWPCSHLSTNPLLHPSNISSIQASSIDPGTSVGVEPTRWVHVPTCGAPAPGNQALPVFKAFCKMRETMKAMEWSADLTGNKDILFGHTLVSKGGGGNTSKNPRSVLFIQNLAANRHDYKVSNIINSLSHLIWFWQCDTIHAVRRGLLRAFDCLVFGSFFAGSPMIPKAGSYAIILMPAIPSTPPVKWVKWSQKACFYCLLGRTAVEKRTRTRKDGLELNCRMIDHNQSHSSSI